MLLSMTGFGEGRADNAQVAVIAEVRSINNRHLKINLRLSDGYQALEQRAEALVRDRLRRGTVQVNLRVSSQTDASDYRLDGDVLASYRSQLAKADPDADPAPLSALLGLPGVVIPPDEATADLENDWKAIQEALSGALDALGEMRRSEGVALAEDLRANAKIIAKELEVIQQRAPKVVDDYRERLADRVSQSLEKLGVTIEESDLVREVALFVDRSDISEEVVRLHSHLDQFEETISLGENTGRKLEFIAQEMGREVNTIGSKANDTEISHRVVEIKAALERVREQVQNVE